MPDLEIRLIPEDGLPAILPLIARQNPGIAMDELRARLDAMVRQGYRCAGAYRDGILVGCAGLWLLTKFYVGRHLEPDNVVVHPDHRGQGIGARLLDWIHAYAREQGCVALELNCALGNPDGHPFWQAKGYRVLDLHYRFDLPQAESGSGSG